MADGFLAKGYEGAGAGGAGDFGGMGWGWLMGLLGMVVGLVGEDCEV